MKYWSSIVLWGALWGLTEATLGYFLHTFSLNIGWVLWFPLAFLFIRSVYRETNSLYSIIFTSFIAAAIKMVDFIMPVSPDRVINPAVSIIFEGLAVFAMFKSIEKKQAAVGWYPYRWAVHFGELLSASIGWRLLYVLYMLLMPEAYARISPLRSGSALLSFLGHECVFNVLLIFGSLKIAELIVKRVKEKGRVVKFRTYKGMSSLLETALSGLMLAAALLAQWKL
ncbi:MAG TPA: hypothetical protein VHT96_10035 [Clostridia bacterium]|nr:hypothetical protein [Clostridia bacterium]